MRLILIFLVLAVSVGAGFVAFKTLNKEKEPEVKIVEKPVVKEVEVPTVNVLVARSAIPVGSVLKPELLDRQPWPSHLVLDDFIVSNGQDTDINGLVSRSGFQAREPLLRSKLANPSDPSFLAAWLTPGNRAVTIAVDGVSGVAGFIFPGDRVDVIVTHQVELPTAETKPGTQPKPLPISEVLVSNVRVLALDQRSSAGAGQGPQVSANITLDVTPEEGQKLRLAETRGSLSLALRGFRKDGEQDLETKDDLPRPITPKDISRTTPPSYFPVLYTSEGAYQSQTINPLAGALAKESSKGGAMKPTVIEATVDFGIGAGQSNVTVIRGTNKETVGVSN